MMISDWMNEKLSSLLDFPVPQDMIEYIMGIENDRDLEDYLKTLLDFTNIQHRNFLQELLQRRQRVTVQQDVQGYKKNDVSEVYFPQKNADKKKKGGKSEDKEGNNGDIKETGDTSSFHGKKKTKYVNLYSQEGLKKDIILLKGRHKCDCQASKHRLINNCLKCGRIVCEQEGSGPCVFCGNLVCSREQQDIITSGSKQSNVLLQQLMDDKPLSLTSAIEHRNRLLEYDKTSEKRTHVIDDESDYYSPNSVWLSETERTRLKEKEEELRAAKYSRQNRITFDFAGRKLVEEAPDYDELYDPNDMILRKISESINNESQSPFSDDSVVNPGLLIHPKFDMRVISGFSSVEKDSWKDLKKLRIQDKEYLEMVDEGFCLSMHQPWASLLIGGIKEHEGRTWYTAHRGRLWIAAAAKVPAPEQIKEIEHMYYILKKEDVRFPTEYPVGCLLGCVNITDCLPQEEYREKFPTGESDSPFVFICQDPQALPIRFPMQGKHKIYSLESKIHQAAVKSLQRVAKLKAEHTLSRK
ncbi:activating signal cointegrator 1 isoform X2 [Lycorma delicatula]|uniref:activating signal cointegrator 1 isoform X2 n=1 Tax=Lycorma delicatula TaxID=130591 RepID=UPI003F5111E9